MINGTYLSTVLAIVLFMFLGAEAWTSKLLEMKLIAGFGAFCIFFHVFAMIVRHVRQTARVEKEENETMKEMLREAPAQKEREMFELDGPMDALVAIAGQKNIEIRVKRRRGKYAVTLLSNENRVSKIESTVSADSLTWAMRMAIDKAGTIMAEGAPQQPTPSGEPTDDPKDET